MERILERHGTNFGTLPNQACNAAGLILQHRGTENDHYRTKKVS